jgi:hypothetical protein
MVATPGKYITHNLLVKLKADLEVIKPCTTHPPPALLSTKQLLRNPLMVRPILFLVGYHLLAVLNNLPAQQLQQEVRRGRLLLLDMQIMRV